MSPGFPVGLHMAERGGEGVGQGVLGVEREREDREKMIMSPCRHVTWFSSGLAHGLYRSVLALALLTGGPRFKACRTLVIRADMPTW
jgi:hypothetical protein